MTPQDAPAHCILCRAPLGQESKDAGWITCHNHRTCTSCHVPLAAQDVRIAYNLIVGTFSDSDDKSQFTLEELKHARCRAAESKVQTITEGSISIKQSYLDYLNYCRLCVEPNPDLSEETNVQTAELMQLKLIQNMSYDEQFKHHSMMIALATQATMLVHSNPNKTKEESIKRDQQKFAEAIKVREKQSVTAPRLVRKKSTLTSKAIEAMQSASNGVIDFPTACEKAYQIEIRKGVAPKMAYATVKEAMLALGTIEEEAVRILGTKGIIL